MKCYYCNSEATTVEHIPPRCIFPKGQRNQLVTVRSCKKHNNSKSGEDEYFRNILTIMMNSNNIGQNEFQERTLKSLKRNKNNSKNFLKNRKRIQFDGRDTYAITLDNKILSYISMMVSGFYFHNFEKTFTDSWDIIIQNKILNITQEYDKAYFELLTNLNKYKKNFRNIKTQNPEIFTYSYLKLSDLVVYRLVFYGGINIYATSISQKHMKLKDMII